MHHLRDNGVEPEVPHFQFFYKNMQFFNTLAESEDSAESAYVQDNHADASIPRANARVIVLEASKMQTSRVIY